MRSYFVLSPVLAFFFLLFHCPLAVLCRPVPSHCPLLAGTAGSLQSPQLSPSVSRGCPVPRSSPLHPLNGHVRLPHLSAFDDCALRAFTVETAGERQPEGARSNWTELAASAMQMHLCSSHVSSQTDPRGATIRWHHSRSGGVRGGSVGGRQRRIERRWQPSCPHRLSTRGFCHRSLAEINRVSYFQPAAVYRRQERHLLPGRQCDLAQQPGGRSGSATH